MLLLTFTFLTTLSHLPQVICAPAPASARIQRRQTELGVGTPVIGPQPTANPIGPPGSSGDLRGGSELIGYNPSDPVATDVSAVIPSSDFKLAPGQSEDPDLGLYLDFEGVENFQPIRGDTDEPTDPGPRNREIEAQNSDFYAPPGTDDGLLANPKWPMGLSHNRHGLGNAGWSRQQNIQNLPIATKMAGVDMALEPWAYRELHWHKANEWSIILNGSVRVQAVNEAGETFIDDLQAGDVWFFPAGVPHSIQAFGSGSEFLLVFDQGDFSDSNTGLVSELFLRNPKAVLGKDLRVNQDAFKNLPQQQLYIFNGKPISSNISTQNSSGPAGAIPKERTYSYHLSQQKPFEVDGGSVKIIDPLSFPVASNFAAALFTIKPGAMRELHWHTTSDEWDCEYPPQSFSPRTGDLILIVE